uniref:AIG1-type G domain-containing protein n=1 Tax=Neogobius melanostomus TaxID=47308 RepID=A0A8C6UST2_9GOBI
LDNTNIKTHYSLFCLEPNNLRVVLVGKSGCGKSSLANTILGGPIFKGTHGSSDSKIRGSEAHSKVIDGRTFTVVDTPGIFNTERAMRELQCEIISCLTLCTPGPHAVLLVLSVERFTAQEAVTHLLLGRREMGNNL